MIYFFLCLFTPKYVINEKIIITGVCVYTLRNSVSLIIEQEKSYPSNPTEPKYNVGGRYLKEYMNFSNFSIIIKLVVVYSFIFSFIKNTITEL